MFSGKTLNYKVNPDEAVSLGATILAGSLKGYTAKVDMIDIIPLSLGLEVEQGEEKLMNVIVPKNT